MSHTAGTLQWKATNFSEEIDWEGAGVAFSVKEWVCEGLCLRNSYKQVELVGEKTRSTPTKDTSWVGSTAGV